MERHLCLNSRLITANILGVQTFRVSLSGLLKKSLILRSIISGSRSIDVCSSENYIFYMSLVVRKPVFGVFDQVLHKPGCTTTEDALRLEISDLESRGIVLSV